MLEPEDFRISSVKHATDLRSFPCFVTEGFQMKSFFKPSSAAITAWLSTIQAQKPTFDIGSKDETRRHFKDHFRIQLGSGHDCYRKACQAIAEWKMFPTSMAELTPVTPAVEEGADLAVTFRAGPLWTTNPCRIVSVVNEKSTRKESFSIAYATLPGHVERGWEQFKVELNNEDDTVWYEINVYSRPKWWPVWLVLPYARNQQRRFRQLSGEAMLAAIK